MYLKNMFYDLTKCRMPYESRNILYGSISEIGWKYCIENDFNPLKFKKHDKEPAEANALLK